MTNYLQLPTVKLDVPVLQFGSIIVILGLIKSLLSPPTDGGEHLIHTDTDQEEWSKQLCVVVHLVAIRLPLEEGGTVVESLGGVIIVSMTHPNRIVFSMKYSFSERLVVTIG